MDNLDDIIKNRLSEEEREYLNELEKRDESKNDKLYLDLFVNLINKIIVADRLSSVTKNTMDDCSDDFISNSFDELSKKLKGSVSSYSKIVKDINDIVMLIHTVTNDINYFWKDCSFEVYQNHYNLIKIKYLQKHVDANEIDFILNEYQYFLDEENLDTNTAHSEVRSHDYLSSVNFRKFLNYDNKQFFSLINKRKIEFLKSEIDKLGYSVEIKEIGEKQKISLIKIPSILEPDLQLKELPNFNVQQRYELFRRLGFDKIIDTLDTSQMSKYKIMGVILNLSPDNTKKLYNRSYKELTDKDIEIVDEYLVKQAVKLKK
jgi:archaellum component FlaC